MKDRTDEFRHQPRRGYAADKLDSLLERAQRDTTEVVQTNDIPKTVTHFAALQNTVDDLKKKSRHCRSTSMH